MIFLKSIELKNKPRPNAFPFTLPIIRNFEPIELTSPVTIFVGENGSGKSTLTEAIAVGLGAIAIGSESLDTDESLHDIRKFSKSLKLVRELTPRQCFFFRAEDFSGFIKKVKARIFCFDDSRISEIDYDSVEHVSLTRSFLNNPDNFTRRL